MPLVRQFMNDVYLLIGGNIGDRLLNIKKTVELIEQYAGRIALSSSIYETAAWGVEDQPAFLNQVIFINTDLSPNGLLEQILAIEEKLGRKRLEKYGPRIVDIDILLFNSAIVNEENLTIPHPFLPHRRFALTPLCEIAPDLQHPTLDKTIKDLLASCKDALPVVQLTNDA